MTTRLVVFTFLERSFATIRAWADSAGHEIALLVTQPARESAPGLRYLNLGGPETTVLAVPDVAGCAATLADLDVDLGIVFTYRRVPDSVASLPRHGTVNLHPTLLPAYRGPNPYRALYAGEAQLGATLHHLTPELDGGAILAQASEPAPDELTPAAAIEAIQRTATEVLQAGVPRALSGDPGEAQNGAVASDAPKFSEDEAVLALDLSAGLFQSRLTALILAGIQPIAILNGERRPLRAARQLRGVSAGAPGPIYLNSRRAVVAATDGVLELELGELQA